jgi:hypothetical protein
VLQEFEVQVEQEPDEDDEPDAFSPPWMPKVEKSFRIWGEPQAGQRTPDSPPMRTKRSKRAAQAWHRNS